MYRKRNESLHGMRPGHEPGGVVASPWYNLAAAIIRTAADDYIKILRGLWKKGTSPEDMRRKRRLIVEKAELEDFFHSSWYKALTDIEPDRLICQCRQTAREMEIASIERANRKKIKELLKEAD